MKRTYTEPALRIEAPGDVITTSPATTTPVIPFPFSTNAQKSSFLLDYEVDASTADYESFNVPE